MGGLVDLGYSEDSGLKLRFPGKPRCSRSVGFLRTGETEADRPFSGGVGCRFSEGWDPAIRRPASLPRHRLDNPVREARCEWMQSVSVSQGIHQRRLWQGPSAV